MKKILVTCLTLLLMIALFGCSTTEKKESKKNVELTISAAASLQEALTDIKAQFEKDHNHVVVNFNFGASGALQQQISQGAPVDLFFSAAEDKFDQLVKDGLIEKSKGTDLVGNQLVLIVPNDSKKSITSFADLVKADKISIGTPEAVPAGQYAKQTLEQLKLWPSVEKKLVYAKDVRQVLTYVETNNVDAGIVYKTDALISSKVKIVATANENTHSPIIYPLGIVKNSAHPKEAKQFYDFLQSETSVKILTKYGFIDVTK